MQTLTVTLKQHTPLIHFQHAQHGATLRASEVKPKLDKFILKELGGGDYEEGRSKAQGNGWLIGKDDSHALNYKLRIISSGRKDYLIASNLSRKEQASLQRLNVQYISPSPYFAQEQENKDIANNSMQFDKIRYKGILFANTTITIIGFKDSLIEELSHHLQSFFLSENFGTRQDKGFGCFTVTSIKKGTDIIPLKRDEEIIKSLFLIAYKKTLNNGVPLSFIFQKITDDYKLLKSGLQNLKKDSLLMNYGLSNTPKHRWDKKFLQQHIDDCYWKNENELYQIKQHKSKSAGSNIRHPFAYLRALLGLPNQYEFLLKNPPNNDQKNKMVVTVKGDNVERIKSPILFKVIGNNIYLLGNTIPLNLFNQTFSIYVNIQEDDYYKDDILDNNLSTPSSFNLKEFIDYSMKEENRQLNYTKLN